MTKLVTRYEDDLRLFRRSRWLQVGMVGLLILYILRSLVLVLLDSF